MRLELTIQLEKVQSDQFWYGCRILIQSTKSNSLDTFYRYQELSEHGEIHTLINRNRRSPNLKNKTDIATEQTVVDYAIEYPVMNGSNWACLFQGVAFVLFGCAII